MLIHPKAREAAPRGYVGIIACDTGSTVRISVASWASCTTRIITACIAMSYASSTGQRTGISLEIAHWNTRIAKNSTISRLASGASHLIGTGCAASDSCWAKRTGKGTHAWNIIARYTCKAICSTVSSCAGSAGSSIWAACVAMRNSNLAWLASEWAAS